MTLKRIYKASTWILGAALYVVILAFATNSASDAVINSIDIQLNQPEDQYFLTEENVTDVLDNQYDSIVNVPVDLINTALLEESLENHALIDNAEVYFTLDGRLFIHIDQHVAIARVRAFGNDVYMNAYGQPIPRSKNHSANVPMITGHIDSSHWQEAYHFLRLLDDSSWLGGEIEAIERDSAGEYTVYPRIGRHHIVWGPLENNAGKLHKLSVFYSYLEENESMNEVKRIDVRFNDQVVSTKY